MLKLDELKVKVWESTLIGALGTDDMETMAQESMAANFGTIMPFEMLLLDTSAKGARGPRGVNRHATRRNRGANSANQNSGFGSEILTGNALGMGA